MTPFDLKPFSTEPKCPKCLGVAIANQFAYDHEFGAPLGPRRINERLQRTCRACGFTWNERTADAKESQ